MSISVQHVCKYVVRVCACIITILYTISLVLKSMEVKDGDIQISVLGAGGIGEA